MAVIAFTSAAQYASLQHAGVVSSLKGLSGKSSSLEPLTNEVFIAASLHALHHHIGDSHHLLAALSGGDHHISNLHQVLEAFCGDEAAADLLSSCSLCCR